MAKAKPDPAQRTVLVVDDEQIVLDSVRKLLRKDPLQVMTTLSAAEGLAAIERTRVHLVLTDMMMPVMDGLEFTRLVKDRWPALPVVMITGYATISTAMQAIKLGAFDYVAKPFTKAELRGVVKRALHLAAASGFADPLPDGLRTLGGSTWLMKEDDGKVRIGVEEAFVAAAGEIQAIDLPAVGDHLRQGMVCLRIFTADQHSHALWSPLSGEVVEVNQRLVADPAGTLQDPYGEGWLLRITPSDFETERRVLGF